VAVVQLAPEKKRRIHPKIKMHQLPIIPLVSLAVASILFGLAYSDAVLYSPAALMACLTFTFATVLAYWIFCQPCQNKEAQPAAESHKTSQLDSPNFWAKIKDWFSPSEKGETKQQNKQNFLPKHFPTGSGEKTEKHSDMDGQVVVFRQTQIIEFLHVSYEELNLSVSLPPQKNRRFLAKKIQVNPEEILMLKKIEIREKSIIYWLVEIGPDSKVLKGSKWLPLDKSLEVSDDEDNATALQDAHKKIEAAQAGEKDLMKKSEPLSKETGVSKAKLQQWYEDDDSLWKVQERKGTKTSLQVSRSGQTSGIADPKNKDHSNRASLETAPDQITALPKDFFDDFHPAKHPSHPHADVDERHPNKVPVRSETAPDQITVLPKTFFDDFHPAKLSAHPNADVDKSRPNQVPADPKPDTDEEINCSQEILITGIVSALTTIILITAFALIFKFFPEEIDQFRNAVNGYAENAKEGLKVEKEKAVEGAQTLWNQMSNYFRQMK
jgi:hypothetical protein